jgi:hypothetical protein
MHLTCQMKILINIYWNYYLNLRKEECFLLIKYILKSTLTWKVVILYICLLFSSQFRFLSNYVQSVRSVTNIIETSKHLNGLTHNELVSKYVLGLKDKFSDHVCLKMFTFDFILIVKSDIPVHIWFSFWTQLV